MLKLKPFGFLMLAGSLMMSSGCATKSAAVDEANQLFAQNQNEKAEAVLKQAAEDDFIDAQVRLAQYYEQLAKTNPEGEQQHLSEARVWYQRAIRNGSAKAEYHFGMLDCNEQINDPQSAESCQFWLESAARKGNTDAQVELANRYYSQREDSVALLNAEFWAEKAAPNSLAAADLLDKIQFAKVEDMNSLEWIVAQDPNKYTIQLNVFADLYDAIDYSFTWGLKGATIYEDRMGNFAVVSGIFDNQAQAQSTIKTLPPNLTSINTQALSFNNVLEFVDPEDIRQAVQQNTTPVQNQAAVVRRQTPRQQAPAVAQQTQQQKTAARKSTEIQQPVAKTKPVSEQAKGKQQQVSQATKPQNNKPAQNKQNDASQKQSAVSEKSVTVTAQPDAQPVGSNQTQQALIQAERDAYDELLAITQPQTWLEEQKSAGRYSVSLVRDLLPTQALKFLELTGLRGAYAHLDKQGTLQLLAGAFDTKEAALQQVKTLPEAFRQFDPKVIDTSKLQ